MPLGEMETWKFLDVIVKPKSSVEEVKQIAPNTFQVKVKEPPTEGRANKRVLELLAKHLNIPKSRLRIKSGASSRRKIIQIVD